jgi:Protein of unknown function (DUF354)
LRHFPLHRTSSEIELASPGQQGLEPAVAPSRMEKRIGNKNGSLSKKIVWVDIDNSPHVPFFLPIVEELQNRGIDVVLTARAAYQVCDLIQSVGELPASGRTIADDHRTSTAPGYFAWISRASSGL